MNRLTGALVMIAAIAAVAVHIRGARAEPGGKGRLRLELFVNDTSKSVAFYKDVLGFEIVREEKDYVPVRLGSVEFGISAVSTLPKQHFFNPEIGTQRHGLGAEIVIEVSDVQAAYDHVKRSGCPILSSLQKRPWGLTDFRIADPDGYYVRISSQS